MLRAQPSRVDAAPRLRHDAPVPTLREWLSERPFTLTLSSGFFGFFAHCGFVSALEAAGLTPTRVTGSSAGALVGGAFASGVTGARMQDRLQRLRRSEFWDPRPGLGVLRGRRFQTLLEELLDEETLERCTTPIGISVYDVLARRTVVVESGDLATAIRASCAVPVMFHPVWIDRRPHLDGGILDRPGLAGVPTGARALLHYLPSRTGRDRGVPTRDGLVSVVVPGLEGVDPFRLDRGPPAIERTRGAVSRALDQPVQPIMRAR